MRTFDSNGHLLTSGSPGATGAQGTQGTQGSIGLQGTQGTLGSQGTQGTQGSIGLQGTQGTLGSQGTQGTQGSLGATGATGAQGSQGSQGSQSTAANDGAVYQAEIATPTGTTSTVGRMMGLAGSITPLGSGNILINICGSTLNNTSSDGTALQIYYGTGSAPVNGDALTGTAVGVLATSVNPVSATAPVFPFELNAVVSGLTIGDTYWVDIGLAAVTGGTASIRTISISIVEVGAGKQGSQGTNGSIGVTGNQGTQGSIGSQGSTGNQGSQGTMGTLGSQGTQGSIGSQGSTGNQGSQGTMGTLGSQGTQGSIGATGAQGSQGTQGSQSTAPAPTGATGAQGTQGTMGTLGSQGTQGSIGLQGTQGTQGSQGSIGTNFLMNPSVTTMSGVTSAVPDITTTQLLNLINIASGMTIYLPSGTPNDGQNLTIRIRNTAATAYSITWATGTIAATGYTARWGAPTLPTRTGATGSVFVGFMYDSNQGLNKWVLINRWG